MPLASIPRATFGSEQSDGFDCRAVAVFALPLTEPAEPLTLPLIILVTVSPVSVPTEVILGCADAVTVPAVAAEPVTFDG